MADSSEAARASVELGASNPLAAVSRQSELLDVETRIAPQPAGCCTSRWLLCAVTVAVLVLLAGGIIITSIITSSSSSSGHRLHAPHAPRPGVVVRAGGLGEIRGLRRPVRRCPRLQLEAPARACWPEPPPP